MDQDGSGGPKGRSTSMRIPLEILARVFEMQAADEPSLVLRQQKLQSAADMRAAARREPKT